MLKKLLLAVAALAMAAGPIQAATLPATPETLQAVLAAARPGDTVRLAKGTYAWVNFSKRTFKPRLTFDATKATITAASYSREVDGLTIKGGLWLNNMPLRFDVSKNITISDATFIGAEPRNGNGLMFMEAANVKVLRSRFDQFATGAWLYDVNGYELDENEFSLMRSDAMQAPGSRKGRITRNYVHDTKLGPTGQEHPDAFQAWSMVGKPPIADLYIGSNRFAGPMAGIDFTDSANGGIDRLVIEENFIFGGLRAAILVSGGRDVKVTGNVIGTWPGSANHSLIDIVTSTGVTRCGNTVLAYRSEPEIVDAPCPR